MDFPFFDFFEIFISAALFVLLFSIGYMVYPSLSSVFGDKFSLLADPLLPESDHLQTNFLPRFQSTLRATYYEWGLCLFLFLATFTYFTKKLSLIATSVYAVALGMALGRLSPLVGNVLSPFAFYCFLGGKALLASLFLFYKSSAVTLSEKLRYLPDRGMREARNAIALHFFSACLLALSVFAFAVAFTFLIQ